MAAHSWPMLSRMFWVRLASRKVLKMIPTTASSSVKKRAYPRVSRKRSPRVIRPDFSFFNSHLPFWRERPQIQACDELGADGHGRTEAVVDWRRLPGDL